MIENQADIGTYSTHTHTHPLTKRRDDDADDGAKIHEINIEL